MGQLTVIASRKGPVWIRWGREGSEFADLDALRNEWKVDATIHLAVEMSRDAAIELMMDLFVKDYWIEGSLWSRAALVQVLRETADVEAERAAGELEEIE